LTSKKRNLPRRYQRAISRRRRQRSGTFLIVLVVIVVVGVAGIVAATSGGGGTSSKRTVASADLMATLTGVPASVFTTVGARSATGLPKAIQAPALTQDAKPKVVYLGAEYCPYCATERWPMVIALSRFGTFSGLKVTHSSSTDVYPDTQTFSFHGATYQSTYLVFEATEMQSNVSSGSGYTTLDTPTAEQRQLLATYDAPPYVDSSSAGAIPFIDFGGKYLISGASYSPSVLAGKTATQIANALSKPSDPIAKGAIGTANALTAAICTLTNNQPAAVCTDPAIRAIQARIK
jgi:hypothetical protein